MKTTNVQNFSFVAHFSQELEGENICLSSLLHKIIYQNSQPVMGLKNLRKYKFQNCCCESKSIEWDAPCFGMTYMLLRYLFI